MKGNWQLPGALEKADGSPRRVGIEIELQGIDVNELAELTAETLGGTVERVSSVEFNVDVPDLGEFRVEVDFKLLKELAREGEGRSDAGDEGLMDFAIELLGGASAVLVPCEIVSPPMPMQSMTEPMDALVERLRAAGAKGTRHSVLYAFGVHLNVEPPDLEAGTVLDYLRAFVCLYDWIVEESRVDVSRQITPYIRPYPRDYDLLDRRPGLRAGLARAHRRLSRTQPDARPRNGHAADVRARRRGTRGRGRRRSAHQAAPGVSLSSVQFLHRRRQLDHSQPLESLGSHRASRFGR